jgi:hypothetical protein
MKINDFFKKKTQSSSGITCKVNIVNKRKTLILKKLYFIFAVKYMNESVTLLAAHRTIQKLQLAIAARSEMMARQQE